MTAVSEVWAVHLEPSEAGEVADALRRVGLSPDPDGLRELVIAWARGSEPEEVQPERPRLSPELQAIAREGIPRLASIAVDLLARRLRGGR